MDAFEPTGVKPEISYDELSARAEPFPDTL